MTPDTANAAIRLLQESLEYGTEEYRARAELLALLAPLAGRGDDEELRESIQWLRDRADEDERQAAEYAYRTEHPRTAEELLSLVADGERPLTEAEDKVWRAIPKEKRDDAEFESAVRAEIKQRQVPRGQWNRLPGGYSQLSYMREVMQRELARSHPAGAATIRENFDKARDKYRAFRERVDAEADRRMKEARP